MSITAVTVWAAVDWLWLVPEAAATATALLSLALLAVQSRRLTRRHARTAADLETQAAQRRRVEEELRAADGFYHSLVESLPAAILRKDRDGRFTFGNRKFCAAMGVDDPGGVVGKTDLDFFPAPLAEKYRADDRRLMASGAVFEAVEEHVGPDGAPLYVQVLKTPLHDPQGEVIGVQAIFWDVTERKRAEELLVSQNARLAEMARSECEAHAALKQAQSQLVQSEKMASLGQIVAGVAHEINNPVAFVSNNVAVLGRDVGEMRDLIALYNRADAAIDRGMPDLAEALRDYRDRTDMPYTLENIDGLLRRSRDGLKRIQQIVGHLRLFARLDEGEVQEADLNDGIESTAAIIVGHARKKAIRLEMDLGALPPVVCNAAKLNQVVMNLMTNAIDACAEGGVVAVRSRAGGEGECEAGRACGVTVEVSDNGCGIDPEVRPRIFDPFFTTKPVGQGTGLGLSISYGIVKDHGGTIEALAAPGGGTRFVVRLPLRPAAKASSRPPAPDPIPPSRRPDGVPV